MPGKRLKTRMIGPWVDPDLLPPVPRPKKSKKPKQRKRFHHAFRVFLALGLMPSKARQCDPLALRLNNTMHVMETECENSGGCLTGESAPELDIGDKKQETAMSLVETKLMELDEEVARPVDNNVAAEDGVNKSSEEMKPVSAKTPVDLETSSAELPLSNGEQASVNLQEVKVEEPDEKYVPSSANEGTEDKPTSDSDKLVTIDNKPSNSSDCELNANGETESTSRKPNSPSATPPASTSPPPAEAVEAVVKNDSNCNGESKPASPACSSSKQSSPQAAPSTLPQEAAKSGDSTSPNPMSAGLCPNINLVKIEPGETTSVREETSCSASLQNDDSNRKRSVEKEVEGEISSGSESDSGRKRVRVEQQDSPATSYNPADQQNCMDYEREKLIQDYIAECSQSTGDLDKAVDKLQKEVTALVELAREKEIEWNTIIRLRKLKEETLERLLRRKRMAAVDSLTADNSSLDNLSLTNFKPAGSNQLMMVPIVSSSPSIVGRPGPPIKTPDYNRLQRPILPKPFSALMDPAIGVPPREGRNGPVLDVKSIIADYSGPSRSRHPDTVPRRGRRVRDVNHRNPPSSLISMANMALGSGSRVRAMNENPYNLAGHHERLPANDLRARDMSSESSPNGTYKDVLAQFAKLTGQPTSNLGGSIPPGGVHKPPPPPYPEVTLHPVGGATGVVIGGGSAVSGGGIVGPRDQSPPATSLLHGILTKNSPVVSRSASFSPTLARLLTAPDRPAHPVPPPPYRPQQQSPRMSIADILTSSKKARNEITITPVGGNNLPIKPKEEPAIIADEEDAESGDRLVIDEGNEEPLQCQGCKQKPAQFVCAGCGNQWYCSRECQVTAWEGHSEVCSG